LTASDATSNNRFGFSVSVSQDTAIIGSPGNGVDKGAVYIFERDIQSWSQKWQFVASDGANYDNFGTSVSVDGAWAIVGSPGHADTRGAAYTFIRVGNTWGQFRKLVASDAAISGGFGSAVSLNGDIAIVGASSNDDTPPNSGAAYIFVKGGTLWPQQAKLTASDAAAQDFFGRSVSVSGDRALVGASGDGEFGGLSGSAYSFVRDGTSWSQEGKVTASDASSSDRFGISVSVSGDALFVGANGDDDAGPGTGSAYTFVCT
jgi:hypothetical protein